MGRWSLWIDSKRAPNGDFVSAAGRQNIVWAKNSADAMKEIYLRAEAPEYLSISHSLDFYPDGMAQEDSGMLFVRQFATMAFDEIAEHSFRMESFPVWRIHTTGRAANELADFMHAFEADWSRRGRAAEAVEA